MRRVDVPASANDLMSIKHVIVQDEHFLGESDTLKRMNADFIYPKKSAKRLSPEIWMQEKDNTMLNETNKNLEELLSGNFKSDLSKRTLEKQNLILISI